MIVFLSKLREDDLTLIIERLIRHVGNRSKVGLKRFTYRHRKPRTIQIIGCICSLTTSRIQFHFATRIFVYRNIQL
jgi:hypothetical protein